MQRRSILFATGIAGVVIVGVVVWQVSTRGEAPTPREDLTVPVRPVGRAAPAGPPAAVPTAPAGLRPADPDGVGPCPEAYAQLPVVRRGRDELGRPTWWHADGSFTKLVRQTVRGADGSVVETPAVVHARPGRRQAPAAK